MNIEIEELAKEFGTTRALHPVSLSIPSGALVALLWQFLPWPRSARRPREFSLLALAQSKVAGREGLWPALRGWPSPVCCSSGVRLRRVRNAS